MNKRIAIGLLLAAGLAANCCMPAWAGSLADGVTLYNQGKYSDALPRLQKAVRENPYDGNSHYYLALCYQSLKQNAMARQHFQWVVDGAKDEKLKAYAATALKSLPAARASGTPGGAPLMQPVTSSAPATSSPQAVRNDLGRCKVIMFETSWCHYCHEFAPDFDAAANKYRGKMDFERVDAEQNADLKERYGVKSYPRLVYLDGKGKVLYNEGRGKFSSRLTELAGN